MSSIAGFVFIQMIGEQLPQLASAVGVIDRRGNDGYGARNEAKKAPEITKVTKEPASLLSTANAAADEYAALKGTYVTVVDDLGRTVYYVLVLDVRVTRVRTILTPSTPGINYIIEAQWSLLPTM